MTSESKSTKPRQLLPLVTAFAIVIVAVLAVRANRAAQPSLFIRSAPNATHASWRDGAWYWVEKRDAAHAVLVRADASGAEREVASGDEIGDFAVGSGHLLVISQTNKTWRVALTDLNSGTVRDVWSGEEQPRGALIANDAAYWLRSKPALIPDAEAFPPMGPQCELMSSPLAGGESSVLETIMEPQGDDVIGVSNSMIWLSASRPGTRGATTIYRVPVAGGAPRRVAAETGLQSAVLTPAGDLYWTAPSREAQNFDQVVCIRRMGASGDTETLNEWLPSGGRLFSTPHGVYYVDGKMASNAWPVTAHSDLPTFVPLADGFSVLAAGDSELLLRSINVPAQKSPLYRVWQR